MASERTDGERRAGAYVRQVKGFRAFIPAELPPNPQIDLGRLTELLSEADRAIGRLDGVSATLPNPDLFVAMYVRRESVLSSQIEGTQSSMDDVLAFELDASAKRLPNDVEEVVNHVAAMNYGLHRLVELPLSLRLIREIHWTFDAWRARAGEVARRVSHEPELDRRYRAKQRTVRTAASA